ncbi:MAG: 3-dehydroquinate synthase [Bacteroidales bacterium]|nr:3-dehydroquinate synthase [Bacteroidales bacterium]
MPTTTRIQELELIGNRSLSKVVVGEFLKNVGNYLPDENVIILSDRNVHDLYSGIFPSFPVIIIEPGEQFKTLTTVEFIYNELLKLEADRSTFLLGIGGGVICDIAGFAASTFMRGINFGFVSTTLLSQVDASVGGKNGVNLGEYKNLVGVFNQPDFVLCDYSMFKTLEEREYISGLAEVIKYALIRDISLLDLFEKQGDAIRQRKKELVQELIWRSVNIKKDVVEEDEFEKGLRRILNFGHTFGHAIEKAHGILHGEAVAYGMLVALYISEREAGLDPEDSSRAKNIIIASGLIRNIDLNSSRINMIFRKDKKKSGNIIRFILIDYLGHAIEWNASIEKLEIYFSEWLNQLDL